MAEDPDPSKMLEDARESIAKVRDLTDDLRAVMEHEQGVVDQIHRDHPKLEIE
jgi:signal transduction histidine kinase